MATHKRHSRRRKIGAVGAAAVAVTGAAGAWIGTANAAIPSASGKIYGCLSNNKPIGLDLLEDEEEGANKLAEALAQKQPLRFTGSELSMIDIGG